MDMSKSRPVFAFLASVALAGTCLAAPGLALANDEIEDAEQGLAEAIADLEELTASMEDGVFEEDAEASVADPDAAVADAEAEDVAADEADDASEAQAIEGGTYTCGGVQITLPEGFEGTDLGVMFLASNEDASIVVSIVPSDASAGAPSDPAEWDAFFMPFAEETVAGSDDVYGEGEVYTLADGTQAYVIPISSQEADGTPIIMVQCYIPFADGSITQVQIACYADDEEIVALADEISESIVLATDGADAEAAGDGAAEAADGQAAEDLQTVQAAGIEFDLPAGYIPEENSTEEEPAWTNAEDTVYVSVSPAILEEYSTLEEGSLDLLALIVVEGLGGELAGSVEMPNGVVAYTFTFPVEGQTVVGVLGMIPLADDTVTSMLALAPLEYAADLDAEVTAVFESVRPIA